MIRLGLVGYPLEHSLSPVLHQAALEALQIAGNYRLYPLDPAGNLEAGFTALSRDLRQGKLAGLNVTIPYKQSILDFLDELTEEASQIGAVNTIFRQGNKLIGDNTDAKGFYHDLCQHFPPASHPGAPASRIALVLGAGGAARAVVYALVRNGWTVWIAARRQEQVVALKTALLAAQSENHNQPEERSTSLSPHAEEDSGVISIIEWGGLPQALLDLAPSLIVNATPLGMSPEIENSPWPHAASWPGQSFIYDLVYNPPNTRWVQQARAAGLPAFNGGGMLVEQAALAFERWTGQHAPRERMEQVLSAELARISALGKLNSG